MNLVVKCVWKTIVTMCLIYWIVRLLVTFFVLFERLFPYLHITFRAQLYCNSFIQQLLNSCVSAQTCITRQLVIPLGWRNLWKNVHLTIERQEWAAWNQEEDGLQKLPVRCCKKKIFMREQRFVCVRGSCGGLFSKESRRDSPVSNTFCSRLSC